MNKSGSARLLEELVGREVAEFRNSTSSSSSPLQLWSSSSVSLTNGAGEGKRLEGGEKGGERTTSDGSGTSLCEREKERE